MVLSCMIGFIANSITIALNYNRLQQLTIDDCLRLAQILTGLRVSFFWFFFYCDWLGFHLRIGHFFSFRCPLNSQSRLQSDGLLIYNLMTTPFYCNCLTNALVLVCAAADIVSGLHEKCLLLVHWHENICWFRGHGKRVPYQVGLHESASP
jgi:hypothetical protein